MSEKSGYLIRLETEGGERKAFEICKGKDSLFDLSQWVWQKGARYKKEIRVTAIVPHGLEGDMNEYPEYTFTLKAPNGEIRTMKVSKEPFHGLEHLYVWIYDITKRSCHDVKILYMVPRLDHF